MGLSVEELADGFRDCGIETGDCILVHSSLSSLGYVDDGPDAVVDALIGAVGRTGTVVFPTLTGCPDNSPTNPPMFDAKLTRCWTGVIPEAARVREAAVRSLHPTHSVVALGEMAGWITSGHERVSTPCGFGSPYDKLASIAGKIVLVGVGQSVNTSFHHVEEAVGAPYVLQDMPVDVTFGDGRGGQVVMRATFLHRWGPRRDYDAFDDPMIRLGICRVGRVGDAEVRVIDAMLQRTFLIRRLLDDPLAVLALSERPNWVRF